FRLSAFRYYPFCSRRCRHPCSTLFPYTTLFRSAMAQSIGYLVAASGPVIFGILFDMTDTWTSSLVLLLVASLILLIVGLGAGKQTTIAQEAEKHASSM